MAFDWKKTLATVAPTIATALGGPMAGMAVKMATSALGIEETEDALMQAVTQGDPAQFTALKQIDADLKIRFRELEIDLAKVNAQDRSGARLLAATKGIVVQATLSLVFVVGYFGLFFFLLWQLFGGQTLAMEFIALISALIGVMANSVAQIMNFWFGSSSGSQKKDQARLPL